MSTAVSAPSRRLRPRRIKRLQARRFWWLLLLAPLVVATAAAILYNRPATAEETITEEFSVTANEVKIAKYSHHFRESWDNKSGKTKAPNVQAHFNGSSLLSRGLAVFWFVVWGSGVPGSWWPRVRVRGGRGHRCRRAVVEV